VLPQPSDLTFHLLGTLLGEAAKRGEGTLPPAFVLTLRKYLQAGRDRVAQHPGVPFLAALGGESEESRPVFIR